MLQTDLWWYLSNPHIYQYPFSQTILWSWPGLCIMQGRNVYTRFSVISVWPLYSTQKGRFLFHTETTETTEIFFFNNGFHEFHELFLSHTETTESTEIFFLNNGLHWFHGYYMFFCYSVFSTTNSTNSTNYNDIAAQYPFCDFRDFCVTLSYIAPSNIFFALFSLFRVFSQSQENPLNPCDPWSQEVPLHKLIHGHYTDNRKRSVLKGIEVRILWNDHISTRSKSTIHKLVIIRVRRNNPQTKVWVNESHISLVNQKEHDILCNLCGCLLFKNFLILFQYLVRDTTGRMFILGYL